MTTMHLMTRRTLLLSAGAVLATATLGGCSNAVGTDAAAL